VKGWLGWFGVGVGVLGLGSLRVALVVSRFGGGCVGIGSHLEIPVVLVVSGHGEGSVPTT